MAQMLSKRFKNAYNYNGLQWWVSDFAKASKTAIFLWTFVHKQPDDVGVSCF